MTRRELLDEIYRLGRLLLHAPQLKGKRPLRWARGPYFRNALQLTRRAVARWVSEDAVDFAVQLGDAIDGRNKEAGQTDQALAEVLASFPEDLPRCDLLGNHELYNFPRARLKRSGLRLRGEGLPGAEPGGDSGCYFAFPADGPAGRWEVVCLDAYDIASIGYAADDPRRAHAEMVLACLNPRTTIPGVDWFEGLPSERHRFVPYNGGLGDDQLDWLRQRLAACAEAGRKVILLSHIPILEASTTPKTVLWNADQVLELLRSWEGRSVVAVLAGHDHDGGYAVDPESGVHHVTFLSPMICKPGSGRSGAATVRCFEDHAELVGHGVFCVESGTSSRGRAYTHIELRRLDPRGWL